MLTTISVDDQLLAEAMGVTGLQSRRDVVERALRMLIAVRKQAGLKRLRGRLPWEGDLEAMRHDQDR